MTRFVSQTLAILAAVMITATSLTAITTVPADTPIAKAATVSVLA